MKVVLLDSDFTHLPQVVMEGRKVIHNVTRTAGLIPEKRPVSCHALWCDCGSDDRHRQPCGADISLAAAFLLDIVRQTAVKE